MRQNKQETKPAAAVVDDADANVDSDAVANVDVDAGVKLKCNLINQFAGSL